MFERILKYFGFVRKTEMPFIRAYSGAKVSRLTSDWVTTFVTADADVRWAMVTLRSRARDLTQNNDYARKYVNMTVANVVGSEGFKLQARAQDDNGRSDEMANRILEAAFADFSKAANCDVSGKLTFRGLQELAVRTLVRDGEVFVRIVKNRKYAHGIALQVIEPDYVDERKNETLGNGNIVRMGVELDEWRRPVAYWLRQVNAETELTTTMVTGEAVRIPAAEIIHVYDMERANQTRGVTWFAASIMRLKMLTGFEEASLVNARASAAKMGFFKSELGNEFTGDTKDAEGNTITYAQPGSFSQLPPGMDFVPYDPKYPSDQHEPFVKSILRGIASGLGCSYNTLANDLEGVNYSSIRSGLLDERETWKRVQALVVEQLLEKVYVAWLDMAMLKGKINLPARKFEKFTRVEWIGRRWQWVDPLKDIEASLMAVNGGLKTRTQIIAEQGGDITDTFEQLAQEQALADKYGIEINDGEKNGTGKSNKPTDAEMDDDGSADVKGGRTNGGNIHQQRAAG